MIELIVKNYLQEKLDVPVGFNTRNDVEEYIVLGKTGTSSNDHINSATFFIQSYSTTKLNACKLNAKVKEVMKDLVNLKEITKVSLNTDYDYTDLNLKKERYQAIFDIGFF